MKPIETINGPDDQKGIIVSDPRNTDMKRICWDVKVNGVYTTRAMYRTEPERSNVCPGCDHVHGPAEGISAMQGELVVLYCAECGEPYFYTKARKDDK